MNEREKIIRLWFDMWLKQQDLGIDKIFTEDVVYTESWCPKYENLKTVKHWFNEWNTRGKVIIWDIKQFFHKENQTVVEWYFKNERSWYLTQSWGRRLQTDFPAPGPVLLFLLPLVSSLPQPSIFTSASPIVSTGSAAAFPRRRLGAASAGRLLFTNSMARSIYASLPLPFGS